MARQATRSSGSRVTSRRQSGIPRALAHRSHTALRTAAAARCTTPFSGPSHRRWLSWVRSRSSAPMNSTMSSDSATDQVPRHLLHHLGDDFGSPADGEGETAAVDTGLVGLQSQVGGRVVPGRRSSHRIRRGRPRSENAGRAPTCARCSPRSWRATVSIQNGSDQPPPGGRCHACLSLFLQSSGREAAEDESQDPISPLSAPEPPAGRGWRCTFRCRRAWPTGIP